MKIVSVVWDDATMAGWWADGDRPPEPEQALVTTVGFLARKTAKHVVVVQSKTDGQHGNVTQIPRGMVQSITELVPAVKKPRAKRGTAGTKSRPKVSHDGSQEVTQLSLPEVAETAKPLISLEAGVGIEPA